MKIRVILIFLSTYLFNFTGNCQNKEDSTISCSCNYGYGYGEYLLIERSNAINDTTIVQLLFSDSCFFRSFNSVGDSSTTVHISTYRQWKFGDSSLAPYDVFKILDTAIYFQVNRNLATRISTRYGVESQFRVYDYHNDSISINLYYELIDGIPLALFLNHTKFGVFKTQKLVPLLLVFDKKIIYPKKNRHLRR